ncbi:MAG: hypothetical protein HY016_12255 [Nitrosomonadales bacterium]|nr:hypothetical protein [Nitrosomonadales bacterium]
MSCAIAIQDLKELAPFLTVVVSILALTIGPIVNGHVARAQAVAVMREKWIYAFRDCLVELITEFDVIHESISVDGIRASEDYDDIIKKLRTLENRIRLMVNSDEPLYESLLSSIEETVSMLVIGITDYDRFHVLNESVKRHAQAAIRNEWKKIPP